MSKHARYAADIGTGSTASDACDSNRVDSEIKGNVVRFDGRYGFVSDGSQDYFFHRKDIVAGAILPTQRGGRGPSVTFTVGQDELKQLTNRQKAFTVRVKGARRSDDQRPVPDVLSDAYIESVLPGSPLATILKIIARDQRKTVTSVTRLVNQLAATDVICHMSNHSVVLIGFAAATDQHTRVMEAEKLVAAMADKMSMRIQKPVYQTGSTLGITFNDTKIASEFIAYVNGLKRDGKTGLMTAPLDPIRWRESQLRYLQSDRNGPVGSAQTGSNKWTKRGVRKESVTSDQAHRGVIGPMFVLQQQATPAQPTLIDSSSDNAAEVAPVVPAVTTVVRTSEMSSTAAINSEVQDTGMDLETTEEPKPSVVIIRVRRPSTAKIAKCEASLLTKDSDNSTATTTKQGDQDERASPEVQQAYDRKELQQQISSISQGRKSLKRAGLDEEYAVYEQVERSLVKKLNDLEASESKNSKDSQFEQLATDQLDKGG